MDLILQYLTRLREEGWTVVRQPYSCEGDSCVESYVQILNVPRERLVEVEDKAYDIAFTLWGENPLPLILGVMTPEKTRAAFPQVDPQVNVSPAESDPT